MDIEIILEPDLTPQQVAEIAVAAEEAGARTLWHSNYHDNWDAFVALVPAAQATSKIRLGVLAVSPYEMHPLKIANAILSLNELSSGRAIIAIGALTGNSNKRLFKRFSRSERGRQILRERRDLYDILSDTDRMLAMSPGS